MKKLLLFSILFSTAPFHTYANENDDEDVYASGYDMRAPTGLSRFVGAALVCVTTGVIIENCAPATILCCACGTASCVGCVYRHRGALNKIITKEPSATK